MGIMSRGTSRWAIRVTDDLWRDFGEAARAAGTDRSSLIRQFIRWYLRRDKLPKRP